jgi:hypothetical protein
VAALARAGPIRRREEVLTAAVEVLILVAAIVVAEVLTKKDKQSEF